MLHISSLAIVTNYLTVLTVNGPAPHFRQKADKAGHSGLYTSHPGDERAQKRAHLKQTRPHFRTRKLDAQRACFWATLFHNGS